MILFSLTDTSPQDENIFVNNTQKIESQNIIKNILITLGVNNPKAGSSRQSPPRFRGKRALVIHILHA